MKKNYFLLVFFGVLLLCACDKENIDPLMEDQAQTQLEESALKGAKKHAVPFKAEFIQRQLTEKQTGPILHLTMEGEGTASHLGKTTILVDQTWDFTLQPPESEPDAGAVGYGTNVFISANGDELYATFDSYNKVEIMGPSGPVYILVWGNGKFDKGTGRFTHATGEYTFSGYFVVADKLAKMASKGTIKY